MTDDEQGEIKRSLQGDHEAFESLVQRYQRINELGGMMPENLSVAESIKEVTQPFRPTPTSCRA